MASNTTRLGLLKKDPIADGNDTFNIETMLNENWDKIDKKVPILDPVTGKVPTDQVDIDPNSFASAEEFNEHLANYIKHPGISATAGTSKAYTVTLDPAPLDIPEFFWITIIPHVTNVASPTLNVNGRGVIALKDQKGVAYAAGKLLAGKPYSFRKIGSDFFADSGEEGEYGNVIAKDVRKGKTFGTDDGVVNGTLDLVNLTPSNLRYGVVIDGIAGNITPLLPGDNWVFSHQYGNSITRTYPVEYYKTRVSSGGTYRLKYMIANSNVGDKASSQIYIDGVPKGILRQNGGTPGYITYTEDIHIPTGSVLSIAAWASSLNGSGNSQYVNLQPLQIGIMPMTFTLV